MKISPAILLSCLIPLSVNVHAQCDIETGKELFNKCVACHKTNTVDGHFVGPNLHTLAGRTVGSVDGFKFSRQMRKDTRIWDQALFDQFIAAPAELFPRTRMGFAGIKDSQERHDLYCYLQSLQEQK